MCVSTGKEASLRVYVWRTLRKLGSVHLHQSVCLLPDRPKVRRAVDRMVLKVRGQGGQARVLTAVFDSSEDEVLRAEQRAARDVEYAEVVERVPQFLAEIELETSRGRATYVEVEESEADLERFHRWLAAIGERDYFQAPRGDEARVEVQRCVGALAAFESAALAADTSDLVGGVGTAASTGPVPQLSIVEDPR